MKQYVDFMNEITEDELYKGFLAYGMFSEKLPPIFTSTGFYKYCVSTLKQPFAKTERDYIPFDSMRDINIPRSLGIPNPMAYQNLCEVLKINWKLIQQHFQQYTGGQKYKTSRIHIRKRNNKDSLFEMKYNDWRQDGTPETDLLIGSRYVIHADISTCFPSIYTHALCWALAGKTVAKDDRKKKRWFNQIDEACMKVKNGETHGLMIGPHTSNLLSEIILVVIDKKLLDKGWRFIRNIDDYKCYVETYEKAQEFLRDLREELRYFDLPLNHKKTKIEKLPSALLEKWVRKLSTISLIASFGKVRYTEAKAFIDLAIELMKSNEENVENAAILNYAIKKLSNQPLTPNAKMLCTKTIIHLAIIYPYLIPLLQRYVFEPYGTQKEEIQRFANIIYGQAKQDDNFEAACYAIYYSLKYDFKIDSINPNDMLTSDSCLFKLFGKCYFGRYGIETDKEQFREHAEELEKNDMDRNWLFVYETLPSNVLEGDWKAIKEAGVSFLVPEFREK